MAVFLVVMLLLVAALLALRAKLLPGGDVELTINNDKKITVETGNSLISTLAEHQVYLPSACGGQGFVRTVQVPCYRWRGRNATYRERLFHP